MENVAVHDLFFMPSLMDFTKNVISSSFLECLRIQSKEGVIVLVIAMGIKVIYGRIEKSALTFPSRNKI